MKSRPFTDPRSRRAPIDMFFRSIAAGRGDGIAVVLTGAGSDGALGVRAIKEGGGIVMVQEPAEAGFPSMPQNAIATGVADVVAPLARLAERIAEARAQQGGGFARSTRTAPPTISAASSPPSSGRGPATTSPATSARPCCDAFSGGCRSARSPIRSSYLQHLRANPEEAKALLSDLLISVTMFFRDSGDLHRAEPPRHPAAARGRGTPARSRMTSGAWVVGCATGEEAYSLAILLLEEGRAAEGEPSHPDLRHRPRRGCVGDRSGGPATPRSIEADVSAERLKRFFVDEGTHYRIDRQVRDLVLFANHSVVREPPFMRLDLITCRNVLIYLERTLQQHVNSIFRYGLKADGYLFLGTAETADTSDKPFRGDRSRCPHLSCLADTTGVRAHLGRRRRRGSPAGQR